MKLVNVTLTGADSSVDPNDLAEISREYPFVEWGILFSKSKVGQPRYPTIEWVEKLAEVVRREASKLILMSLSAHLCGSLVEDAINGNISFINEPYADIFEKIQLNMGKKVKQAIECKPLIEAVKKITSHEIIFGGDYSLVDDCDVLWQNCISPLFDASGGRGLEAKDWKKPLKSSLGIRILHGYAGGIGPDNVVEELKKLKYVVDDSNFPNSFIWIDMETKIRNNDVFDLEKCRQALKLTFPWA